MGTSLLWQTNIQLHDAVQRQLGWEPTNLIHITPVASTGQIKAQIEEALRRSAEVDARNIRVHVEHSTVTLSGDVHSWAERQEAEGGAWAAPGVSHVENRIAVTP